MLAQDGVNRALPTPQRATPAPHLHILDVRVRPILHQVLDALALLLGSLLKLHGRAGRRAKSAQKDTALRIWEAKGLVAPRAHVVQDAATLTGNSHCSQQHGADSGVLGAFGAQAVHQAG